MGGWGGVLDFGGTFKTRNWRSARTFLRGYTPSRLGIAVWIRCGGMDQSAEFIRLNRIIISYQEKSRPFFLGRLCGDPVPLVEWPSLSGKLASKPFDRGQLTLTS